MQYDFWLGFFCVCCVCVTYPYLLAMCRLIYVSFLMKYNRFYRHYYYVSLVFSVNIIRMPYDHQKSLGTLSGTSSAWLRLPLEKLDVHTHCPSDGEEYYINAVYNEIVRIVVLTWSRVCLWFPRLMMRILQSHLKPGDLPTTWVNRTIGKYHVRYNNFVI